MSMYECNPPFCPSDGNVDIIHTFSLLKHGVKTASFNDQCCIING